MKQRIRSIHHRAQSQRRRVAAAVKRVLRGWAYRNIVRALRSPKRGVHHYFWRQVDRVFRIGPQD